MDKKLCEAWYNAKQEMISAITEFVRENGKEMNDYFYNNLGINEEDDGDKVIKVLDVSEPGCHFANQCFDNVEKKYSTEDFARDNFTHTAYWAFYIVRNAEDGRECLKFYASVSLGISFDVDGAEPEHGKVRSLSICEIARILDILVERFS